MFEPQKSFDRFEIHSSNPSKVPWKITGMGNNARVLECPDGFSLKLLKIINKNLEKLGRA